MLLLYLSVYLLVDVYLLACALLIALLFSMPKRKSLKDFFQQARDKGSKSNKDIVNGNEIRKNSSPNREELLLLILHRLSLRLCGSPIKGS
jgi:hypothetical protein